MLNFFKKIFFKDNSNQDYKPGTNQYYIEKYKDFDSVIKTYYQAKDHNGKIINIDSIVAPLKIDNRQLCSVTDNQRQTPHCASFSICNLCEALLWKRTGKLINLDANQVYAKAKTIDGMINQDGTSLEAAIKAAIQLGGFGEQSKNIKIGFLYNDKTDNTIQYIKHLIHKYDFLHIGFIIKSGIYTCNQRNYIVNFSGYNLGGHAMLCCGYLPEGLIIQNSWGINFGSKGFCIIKWEDVKQYLMYCCYI
jgi:hypothetical protein